MDQPEIVSVNISSTKGVVKKPVPEGCLEPDVGLVGDAHSGPWHRQLSLLAMESIDFMRGKGAEVNPGDFAENVTTKGIELHTLPVGTRLKLGKVEVEVTQIGKECHAGCAIRELVGDCIMPRQGIFVKVLNPGTVRAGDPVRRLDG
ncbi:MAG: MOSC domain-containing protein [Desulfarculaceae bacterium]|nr:MOSC domain-containing protein [Desulfarculaceae bacterium]MCF8070991.1 MOSC domain-containing protein [Desulfarculaceae bacterium]MCF8100579.1 MOSC domain-containing protein [Desulfarculaceae bacterium]MCF8117711.1 MOSC domain-containing protein [Desulfarculaceae bacterium]